MTTVIIESNSAQATSFVEYARTLPFATIVEEKKKSFEEACAECNGRPASEFFDELRYQVKQHFKNA
jgi:hypothetical protein